MLTPLHDNVIVERDEAEKKIGKIHLPDVARDRPQQGTVIAIGPGKMVDGKLQPMSDRLKVGAKVIFTMYGGDEVEHDGKKLLAIPESKILAVLTEGK